MNVCNLQVEYKRPETTTWNTSTSIGRYNYQVIQNNVENNGQIKMEM